MNRNLASLLLVVVVGCSSDDDAAAAVGAEGPAVQQVILPLDQAIGAVPTEEARPLAFGSSFLPRPDGSAITCRGFEISHRKLDGTAIWTSAPVVGEEDQWVNACPFASTSDGGVVVIRQDGMTTALGSMKLDGNGKRVWSHFIPRVVTGISTKLVAVLLPSGVMVASFGSAEENATAEQIDAAPVVLGLFDSNDGHEIGRSPIPTVHVAAADNHGAPELGRSPGTGWPFVEELAVTSDGGVLVAGHYQFRAAIECGTAADPKPPQNRSCVTENDDGLVARFDATGKFLWASRLGTPWTTPNATFNRVVELTDGSILATGTTLTKPGMDFNPPIQALVYKLSADGHPISAKSHPWGPPPGHKFTEGLPTFDALIPTPDGGFDAVFHPPMKEACRFTHIDGQGTLTRSQPFDLPNLAGLLCQPMAFGSDLYLPSTVDPKIYKIGR